jgi:hypothetical protein
MLADLVASSATLNHFSTESIVYHPQAVAALSTTLRRTIGARQIALAVIAICLATLLAWYLVAIWFDLAPWLRGWKRYPDGWSWRFLETVPRWDRFLSAGLGLGIIAAGLASLTRRTRWGTVLGLAVLIAGVYVLQIGTLALKLSSPNALLVQRVLDEDFTGYLKAAQSVDSPVEFLTDWRRLMKACGHCTSHPTGASAFYWPMVRVAELLPAETAQATSDWLVESLRLRVRNVGATSVIGAFLNGHLNLLLAAMSVVPFYYLGRMVSGKSHGGVLAAGLVATMPGLILMSPELDQVYVLIGGTALLTLLLSLRAADWPSRVGLGFVSGLLVALGLFFTWGLLVWIPLLACLCAAFALGLHVYGQSHLVEPLDRLGRAIITAATALVGLILPYLLLAQLTPYDVRDVARQGLGHYQTFEAIGRPGEAVWLFHGPLDTTQFIGLPLTLATLCVLFASSGKVWLPLVTRLSERLGAVNVYSVALLGMIAVMFLGSYMKAESGRQLLFLMPFGAVAVAAGVRAGSAEARPWQWALLAAQALVTVVIGARWITP